MMLRSLLLISIATGALAGCGLKGPLYLPTPEGEKTTPPGQAQGQRKERTRETSTPTQPPAGGPGDMGTPPPPTLPREH